MVTSSSGGIYNVNVTILVGTNTTVGYGFSVDANNATVLSATVSGYTIPKSEAKSFFDESMAFFGLQQYYSGDIGLFTAGQYFHSTGTATMTYGTTSFPVTTYAANTLPFMINQCGVNSSFTAYTLEIGTPPGTTLQFITFLHVAGTSNGIFADVTFQLVSMVTG